MLKRYILGIIEIVLLLILFSVPPTLISSKDDLGVIGGAAGVVILVPAIYMVGKKFVDTFKKEKLDEKAV